MHVPGNKLRTAAGDVHCAPSPQERLDVESVGRFDEVVRRILARLDVTSHGLRHLAAPALISG
jgi:hypothetical protein